MKKEISILGSTGSIGLSAIEIIKKKKNLFNFNLLTANKNYKLICKQIKEFKPRHFIIYNSKIYKKVIKKFKGSSVKVHNSFEIIKNIRKSEISISAIPGIIGLYPTILLIKKSKKILIANKESIICGWNLIQKEIKKYKTNLIPIDSEHFSVMQLLEKHKLNEIKMIYITASGGPFLNLKKNKFRNIKPKDALKHPKWKMGKKISIDSATLMNKILELIEAQKLFNIPNKKLDILIHPDSLVHAIVKLKNGLTKFIYHETSMLIPLANAIFDGNLNIEDFKKSSRKGNIENLIFKKVDKSRFPIIKIKDKANEYPSTSIIVNASNEILVDQFLQKKIPFLTIIKIIMIILNDRNYRKYAIRKPKNIEEIYNIDKWARKTTFEIIKKNE